MKDYELLQKSLAELMKPVLEAMPLQQRLEGLTPEQLASALPREHRLDGLTPDDIVALLNALPEDTRERIKQRMN